MEPNEIWEKVKEALEKGFVATKDVTVKSAKVVATYAGEAGQLTKYKINEMKISRQLAKEFAALGARIYELSSKKNGDNVLDDKKVKESLAKTKSYDQKLQKVHTQVQSEKTKIRQLSKKKTVKKSD